MCKISRKKGKKGKKGKKREEERRTKGEGGAPSSSPDHPGLHRTAKI